MNPLTQPQINLSTLNITSPKTSFGMLSVSQNTSRPMSAPAPSIATTPTVQFSEEAAKLLASTISLWKVPKKKVTSWKDRFRSAESRELNKMKGMTMKLSDVVNVLAKTLESSKGDESELSAMDIHEKTLSAICLPQISHLVSSRNVEDNDSDRSIWSYLLQKRPSNMQLAAQRVNNIQKIITHLKHCPLFNPTAIRRTTTDTTASLDPGSKSSTANPNGNLGSNKFAELCNALGHHPHITIQAFSPRTILSSPISNATHIHIITSGTINVSATYKAEDGNKEILLCTIEQYGVINLESAIFSTPAYRKWRRCLRKKRLQEEKDRLEKSGQEETDPEIILKAKDDHIKQMEWDENELNLDEELMGNSLSSSTSAMLYPPYHAINPLLNIVKLTKSESRHHHHHHGSSSTKSTKKTTWLWHEWATYETVSAVEIVSIPINVFLSHISSHEMLTNYAYVSTMYKHWHYRTLYCNAVTRLIRVLTITNGENGEEATDSTVRGSDLTRPTTQLNLHRRTKTKVTAVHTIEVPKRKHHQIIHNPFINQTVLDGSTTTRSNQAPTINNFLATSSPIDEAKEQIDTLCMRETSSSDVISSKPVSFQIPPQDEDVSGLDTTRQRSARRRLIRNRWQSSAYIITTQLLAQNKMNDRISLDDSHILNTNPNNITKLDDELIHYRRDSAMHDKSLTRRDCTINQIDETNREINGIDCDNTIASISLSPRSVFLETHSPASIIANEKKIMDEESLILPEDAKSNAKEEANKQIHTNEQLDLTKSINLRTMKTASEPKSSQTLSLSSAIIRKTKDIPRVKSIHNNPKVSFSKQIRNRPSKAEIYDTAEECLKRMHEDKQIDDFRRALLTESTGSNQTKYDRFSMHGTFAENNDNTTNNNHSKKGNTSPKPRPETAPLIRSTTSIPRQRMKIAEVRRHSQQSSISHDVHNDNIEFDILQSFSKTKSTSHNRRRTSSKAFPLSWKERLANLMEVSYHQSNVI